MARILVVFLALSLSSFAQTTNPLAAADQLFERAQYAQAAAAFERLPETNKSVSVWNRLGISYHMTDRMKEAEAAYRRAIRIDSKFGAAYNNLGALFYTERNFGEADSQFRRAAQRSPQNATIRRNFHASRYARENLRPARAAAEQLS